MDGRQNQDIHMNKHAANRFIESGEAHYENKELKEAIEDFETASKLLGQRSFLLFFNIGNAYAQLGEFNSAILNFTKALELKNYDADTYRQRGIIYLMLGDFQLAIEDFKKALEYKPQLIDLHLMLTQCYQNLQKFDQANLSLAQAREEFLQSGIQLKRKKQYNEAIDQFNKIIELDPNFDKAYFQRGKAHQALKDYRTAILDFDKTIDLNPNSLEAYFYRGNTYAKLKEYKKAIVDYNIILKDAPNDYLFDTYNNRGYCFHWLKQSDNAFLDYIQAVSNFTTSQKVVTNFTILLNESSKSNIFAWIEKITDNQHKISVLKQALDKSTLLGQRFWKQEGQRECSLERGSLKKISILLKDLEAFEKDLEAFEKKYNDLPSQRNSFFFWDKLEKVDPKKYEQTENEILDNERIFKL